VQVDAMKSKLQAPGRKRVTLKRDEALSNFAFNFNLRCYTEEAALAATTNGTRGVTETAAAGGAAEAGPSM